MSRGIKKPASSDAGLFRCQFAELSRYSRLLASEIVAVCVQPKVRAGIGGGVGPSDIVTEEASRSFGDFTRVGVFASQLCTEHMSSTFERFRVNFEAEFLPRIDLTDRGEQYLSLIHI